MNMVRNLPWLALSIWCAIQFCRASQAVSAGIEPDFLMDSDPRLHLPEPVRNFNPALKTLWIAALQRPEVDMQRMAAETIARGHQYGIPDLTAAAPALERVLEAESSHPAARYAAARALIVLESRGSAEKLFSASQAYGADLRQLVEPVLARWDYQPARTVWQQRLAGRETGPRDLSLAMRGLAQVNESSALPDLLSIINDPTREPELRLEAATAAGRLAETGLEQLAERLAQDQELPRFVGPLSAVRCLARHQNEDARKLLLDLAGHQEPVVAAAALARLNEIDSALVLPLAETAMKNPDQRIRAEGAAAYLKLPTPERISPLSQLLADPHSGMRRDICAGLLQLSEKPDLNEAIRAAARQILATDRWQGQEQASLLLGALEDKPAASRLVELLESPRTEVRIASAWALRKAAVSETIPALLDKARRQTELRKHESPPGLDDQVSHLLEALGILKVADATPLLLQYVPKIRGEVDARSRSAAIWAIGRVMAGTPDPQIVDALGARIVDFDLQTPESPLAKQMCAIALARMNAVNEASMLRGVADKVEFPLPLAVSLRWAVKELTGEELPPPKPLTVNQGDWFLEPTR